ncbi:hypothetical protein [uncultured Citrobacter sp.]|uniref:hypothetical protein n=1 Tax=uncultured Citrobacter sp. TaxID=200446 RepID=UPI002593BB90|nr:hypothetical protein [uncultured Citrobacter sp.]
MTTNNHPAQGPVSLDRLHQISEILSKAAAQSDGGNLGYAMADAVKVIDGVIAAFGAEPAITVGDDGGDALAYRRLIQAFQPGTKLYTTPQPAPVSLPEPIKRNDADGWWMYKGRRVGGGCAEWYNRALDDFRDTMLQGADRKPELAVWYGAMPETNGKTNWTAMLHRKGQHPWEGITIDRSEYPDRVRYEADRIRHLIGELPDKPDILSYDADAHSGYVKPGNSPVTPDCWCRTCRPVTMSDMRFVVCPDCGNKRCPRANDHRNVFTGSNEPGQIGSAYPAAPQQEVKP